MELVKGAVYSSPDVQDRATNGLCGSKFRFIIYAIGLGAMDLAVRAAAPEGSNLAHGSY